MVSAVIVTVNNTLFEQALTLRSGSAFKRKVDACGVQGRLSWSCEGPCREHVWPFVIVRAARGHFGRLFAERTTCGVVIVSPG